MEGKPARILIWGAGTFFRTLLPSFREREKNGEIRVVGVVDRRRLDDGAAGGYPYVPPEAVPELEFDYLQILSSRQRGEILGEYLELSGGDRSKVIGNLYPEIGIQRWKRLTEARPTIFTLSCWGGYVCHYLGMECLSPFKNLWLYEKDYMRFLQDPRGYLAEEPVPDRMQNALSRWDRDPYPVLRLGDIRLHCNHSGSMEEAAADWRRRRKKINWEFIVAVMHTSDPETEKEFGRLEGFRRKLCIVPYLSGEPFSTMVPMENGSADVYEWANASSFPFRNPFDMYSAFFGERKENKYYDPRVHF